MKRLEDVYDHELPAVADRLIREPDRRAVESNPFSMNGLLSF